jgi:glyoxylase-like metal-dependent hydrolase (beta-lactamase superfamily II)
MPMWERDLAAVGELGLRLAWTLDTHLHADHITSALHLRREAKSRIANPAMDRLPCADLGIEEGKAFEVGSLRFLPLHTPGHTDSHFAYRIADRVLTGDALLIDGCGRTDFQNGDAQTLYRSIQEKLFTLPEDTLVYPAHDYQQRHVSNIGQERARNPRIGAGRSLDEFAKIMRGLSLPYPKFIDYALPGNRACGVCPADLPGHLAAYCTRMKESPQG